MTGSVKVRGRKVAFEPAQVRAEWVAGVSLTELAGRYRISRERIRGLLGITEGLDVRAFVAPKARQELIEALERAEEFRRSKASEAGKIGAERRWRRPRQAPPPRATPADLELAEVVRRARVEREAQRARIDLEIAARRSEGQTYRRIAAEIGIPYSTAERPRPGRRPDGWELYGAGRRWCPGGHVVDRAGFPAEELGPGAPASLCYNCQQGIDVTESRLAWHAEWGVRFLRRGPVNTGVAGKTVPVGRF